MMHYKLRNKIKSWIRSFIRNCLEKPNFSGFEDNDYDFYPRDLTESELELFNSIEEI